MGMISEIAQSLHGLQYGQLTEIEMEIVDVLVKNGYLTINEEQKVVKDRYHSLSVYIASDDEQYSNKFALADDEFAALKVFQQKHKLDPKNILKFEVDLPK